MVERILPHVALACVHSGSKAVHADLIRRCYAGMTNPERDAKATLKSISKIDADVFAAKFISQQTREKRDLLQTTDEVRHWKQRQSTKIKRIVAASRRLQVVQ